MRHLQVLISGASVAGPALAFWLARAGCAVTVVERAAKLREGGYAVDFRGAAHMSVLERMGLLSKLQALQTGGGGMRFVDPNGRERLVLPDEFAGGDLEVRRADISRLLYFLTKADVTYRFGDSIQRLRQSADGVDVQFEHGPDGRYDFVIGADGIGSNVRRLLYGPERNFITHLGYYVASWDVPALSAPLAQTTIMNRPGRGIGVRGPGRPGAPAGVLCFVASDEVRNLRTLDAQKAMLRKAFAGAGWRADELLATLDAAEDFFFSPISRADVPAWSQGRVALVGDAAHGATIGGMGTGSAMVGAYVLAGELSLRPDAPALAFESYQRVLQAYAQQCQEGGERSAQFLAPRTGRGIFLRNTLVSFPPILNWMLKEGRDISADISLPDYPQLRELVEA